MQPLLDSLHHLVSLIPGGLPMGVAMIVEFALRLIPSEKPKSLILAAASIGHVLSNGIEKLSDLIDEAIPQNSKK